MHNSIWNGECEKWKQSLLWKSAVHFEWILKMHEFNSEAFFSAGVSGYVRDSENVNCNGA